MQLINFLVVLLLPMTILANGEGDDHSGGHPGDVHHPHRFTKYPSYHGSHHGGSPPIGGLSQDAGRPAKTGYPAGTGSPTGHVGGYPTGASHANHGPYRRNYSPSNHGNGNGHGHGHEDDHDQGDEKPRWKNFGKHDGLKPIFPIVPTGVVPDPTTGYYPTGTDVFPLPTGRPSGGLRRRHPRMI